MADRRIPMMRSLGSARNRPVRAVLPCFLRFSPSSPPTGKQPAHSCALRPLAVIRIRSGRGATDLLEVRSATGIPWDDSLGTSAPNGSPNDTPSYQHPTGSRSSTAPYQSGQPALGLSSHQEILYSVRSTILLRLLRLFSCVLISPIK